MRRHRVMGGTASVRSPDRVPPAGASRPSWRRRRGSRQAALRPSWCSRRDRSRKGSHSPGATAERPGDRYRNHAALRCKRAAMPAMHLLAKQRESSPVDRGRSRDGSARRGRDLPMSRKTGRPRFSNVGEPWSPNRCAASQCATPRPRAPRAISRRLGGEHRRRPASSPTELADRMPLSGMWTRRSARCSARRAFEVGPAGDDPSACAADRAPNPKGAIGLLRRCAGRDEPSEGGSHAGRVQAEGFARVQERERRASVSGRAPVLHLPRGLARSGFSTDRAPAEGGRGVFEDRQHETPLRAQQSVFPRFGVPVHRTTLVERERQGTVHPCLVIRHRSVIHCFTPSGIENAMRISRWCVDLAVPSEQAACQCSSRELGVRRRSSTTLVAGGSSAALRRGHMFERTGIGGRACSGRETAFIGVATLVKKETSRPQSPRGAAIAK